MSRFVQPIWCVLLIALTVSCGRPGGQTAGAADAEAGAKPKSTDLTGKPFDLPPVSAETFRAKLLVEGLLPRSKSPANFELDILRAAGEWRSVMGRAIRYNQMNHTVEAEKLQAGDDSLAGTVHITIHPDAWVPADGKKRDIELAFKVSYHKAGEDGLRQATGTYTATIKHPDGGRKEMAGKVRGVISPTHLPGTWSQGSQAGEDGVAMRFDMGTRRVNWNHFRCAVQELPRVSDLSDYRGVRVTVGTDKPRQDASVTLWIRELDGSWYYVRSAVPLAGRTHTAEIDFADFSEAEWVAPGSHVDEDYRIDLSSISHLAIGVVNPLGVGEVAFALRKIELTDKPDVDPVTPQATCTGKMLAVNGHNVIPAGLFGGFAGHMPQEYRPGCQRHLYARSYPRNPWQNWYHFHTSCFTDWPKLMDIFAGKVDRYRAVVDYLHSRVDEGEFKRRFERFDLDKHRKGRDGNVSPRELRGFLDRLLGVENLYDPAAWKGIDLPDGVVANVRKKDKDDVELYEYNRALIEATFSGLIKPRPDHGPSDMFYINCFGERKQPATMFTNSNGWEDQLRGFARSLSDNARDFQKYGEVVLEFWNEPYLHWGSKDRVNLKTHYYRRDLAKEGGPVRLKISPEIERSHILSWPKLAELAGRKDPVGELVADTLSGNRDWQKYDPNAGEPDRGVQGRVVRDLSRALDSKSLATAEHWNDVKLPARVASLLAGARKDDLSDYQRKVLNRSLLTVAAPEVFAENPALDDGPIVPHFVWRKDDQGRLRVEDETAFTYWSGKGNGWIYDRMYGVIASEVKKHNPKITTLAGWGFRWNEDHWAAWDLLYKNTIDRNIDVIDGIHEHHYQGDVTAMPGTYEVLTAYGVTKHGKWLYSYNTETNDLVDAPSRGNVSSSAEARRATEYRRMSYNLRDVVYCAYQTPDKARGRTMIHPTQTPQALHVGYGLVRNLRGRLVECQTSDPDVWMVASVDGTDPNAMPPNSDGRQKLVVVVFNDHREDREVDIVVRAPTGTTFADGRSERTHVDRDDYRISRPGEDVSADGKTKLTFRGVSIQGRGAWKIELPLSADVTETDEVLRRQFFSPDILLQVAGDDKPVKTAVKLDEDWLSNASRAWLRVVVESVAAGEAGVKVGDTKLTLPKAYTADNVTRIQMLEIPVKSLKARTPLEFVVNGAGHAGYRVDMASIVLEKRVSR